METLLLSVIGFIGCGIAIFYIAVTIIKERINAKELSEAANQIMERPSRELLRHEPGGIAPYIVEPDPEKLTVDRQYITALRQEAHHERHKAMKLKKEIEELQARLHKDFGVGKPESPPIRQLMVKK